MKYANEFLWVLLPFAIGWGGLYFIPAPLLSQIIIVIYWSWVGKRFAGLDMSWIRSFALGNSVWGICLVIFMWQFLLESEGHRNTLLELVSQYYVSSFYWVTHVFPSMFNTNLTTWTVTVLSLIGYFLMLFVFTLGFTLGRRKHRTAT